MVVFFYLFSGATARSFPGTGMGCGISLWWTVQQ